MYHAYLVGFCHYSYCLIWKYVVNFTCVIQVSCLYHMMIESTHKSRNDELMYEIQKRRAFSCISYVYYLKEKIYTLTRVREILHERGTRFRYTGCSLKRINWLYFFFPYRNEIDIDRDKYVRQRQNLSPFFPTLNICLYLFHPTLT